MVVIGGDAVVVVPEGSWTGLLVVGFVGLLKMKSSFSCIPSEFMSVDTFYVVFIVHLSQTLHFGIIFHGP